MLLQLKTIWEHALKKRFKMRRTKDLVIGPRWKIKYFLGNGSDRHVHKKRTFSKYTSNPSFLSRTIAPIKSQQFQGFLGKNPEMGAPSQPPKSRKIPMGGLAVLKNQPGAPPVSLSGD